MSDNETNFQKLLNHIEKDKIISKLVSGETPKQVSEYLKIKYHQPEERSLNLSAAFLQEFVDRYLNQYNFLNKIISDEKNGKIDKAVAKSLLENKTWKDRIAQLADDEIDFKKRIVQVLTMVEARAEQIFDKIQENPRVTRDDYVLIKYFENLCQLIEKADKLVNDRPDQLIQHNVSVQMVEQHSVVFQEAIRAVLREMDPEISAKFMELLTEKLNALHGATHGLADSRPLSLEQKKELAESILPKDVEEAEFEAEAGMPDDAEDIGESVGEDIDDGEDDE